MITHVPIKLDYLGDICRINISNRNFKLFSNMKFKQFVVNEYVSFLNMKSVRRETRKKRCNSSFASKKFDKIFKAALNPDHIKTSLAAIREVNAAFAGKIPQMFLKVNLFYLEKFEIDDEKNRRNMKYETYLLQAEEDRMDELRASILTFFMSTCIYIFISKTTGFIICYLEDCATQTFGYSSYNFCIFNLTFYIFVGIFSYYYLSRVILSIFTDGIFKKSCCQRNSCPFPAMKCANYINLFHEHELPYNFEAIMNVFSEPD